MLPAITVVITAYNLSDHIDTCLKKLMGQTFQDFDIIIIDDASTDGTRDIIENWKANYPERISALYMKQNMGMPALARNMALDSGQIDGEYVLFLDGDDVIEPNMLERMYDTAISSGLKSPKARADIVVCAYDRIDLETGRVLATEMRNFPQTINLPPDDDLLAFINTASWNKIWRREVIKDIRYSKYKVGEEIVFSYKAYHKSRRIDFIDDVLIHYGVRPESVISNTDDVSIWEFAKGVSEYYRELTGTYKEIFGVVAFLHIGLSMSLRAANKKQIDIKAHIRRTTEYFKEEFSWFKGNQYLKFSSLAKKGMKGIMIWTALAMYRLKIFEIALFLYKKLRLNVKF